MPTPENFLTYTQWSGIAMLVFGVLTGLAFVLKWGLRFRLVGVTGFLGVMTVGLFSLTLMPLSRSMDPNSVRYSLVYDTGGPEAVIVVPATITQPQLVATLEQAANNYFSPGRLGNATSQFTIRARTVLHPEAGVSVPLYLGQVTRSLAVRNDPNMNVTVFDQNMALLPQESPSSS